MKLGIMQPYFFPYVGYFDLINSVDRWIVADSVQYMRRGWVNRNRVMRQESGWQYITVPVRRRPLDTPIKEIEIARNEPWQQMILRSIEHYHVKAPYFEETFDLVKRSLRHEAVTLARLNVALLSNVCFRLGIKFQYQYLSELGLELKGMQGPEDWAIRISSALQADEYINPPGGEKLYSPANFKKHGIKLTIKPLVDFQYDCGPREFIPNLSIVDVLMWNKPRKVKQYLDSVRESELISTR